MSFVVLLWRGVGGDGGVSGSNVTSANGFGSCRWCRDGRQGKRPVDEYLN